MAPGVGPVPSHTGFQSGRRLGLEDEFELDGCGSADAVRCGRHRNVSSGAGSLTGKERRPWSGQRFGVTSFDNADSALVPAEFVAVTENRYFTPAFSPPIETDVADADTATDPTFVPASYTHTV
jgi:hypothetical protein